MLNEPEHPDEIVESADEIVECADEIGERADEIVESADEIVERADEIVESPDEIVEPSDCQVLHVTLPDGEVIELLVDNNIPTLAISTASLEIDNVTSDVQSSSAAVESEFVVGVDGKRKPRKK